MGQMRTEIREGREVEILEVGEARAEIHPHLGGALGRLCLPLGGGTCEVVSGWEGEGADNPAYRGAVLMPWPNRVADARFTFRGEQHLLEVTEPARGHALHGLVAHAPFRVASRRVEPGCCRLELMLIYEGQAIGFPYPFRAHLAWILSEGGLRLEVEALNLGREPMPFGFGWHPYLGLEVPVDGLRLQAPAGSQYLTDDRMIPTGAVLGGPELRGGIALADQAFDTLFQLEGPDAEACTRLWDPGQGHGVEVWQQTGPGKLNHLCVYTPPDRRSIALEPMSCAIDAFHSGDGLLELAPGARFEAAMGIRPLTEEMIR